MSMHNVLIKTVSRSDLGAWWCNVTVLVCPQIVIRQGARYFFAGWIQLCRDGDVMVTVSTCDAIDAKRKCNCSKMIYFSSLY